MKDSSGARPRASTIRARLPLQAAHRAVLERVCSRLPLDDLDWALTGSLGARLQGVDVEVHDVDIQTSERDVGAAASLLDEFVTSPLHEWISDRMRSQFARFSIDGVEVELMAGMQKRTSIDVGWSEPVSPCEHRVIVLLDDLEIPVLSLEYEARAYEEIGRHERAAQLRAVAGLYK